MQFNLVPFIKKESKKQRKRARKHTADSMHTFRTSWPLTGKIIMGELL